MRAPVLMPVTSLNRGRVPAAVVETCHARMGPSLLRRGCTVAHDEVSLFLDVSDDPLELAIRLDVLDEAGGKDFENLLIAAQSCPTQAISIVDRKSGRRIYPPE
jgi:ferredoxin